MSENENLLKDLLEMFEKADADSEKVLDKITPFTNGQQAEVMGLVLLKMLSSFLHVCVDPEKREAHMDSLADKAILLANSYDVLRREPTSNVH